MALGFIADGTPGFALDSGVSGDHDTGQLLTVINHIERYFLWKLCLINLRRSHFLVDLALGVFSTWNSDKPEQFFRFSQDQRESNPQNAAINSAFCFSGFLDQ